MGLISLSCHHCGASLSIPDDARYVTCRFCGSQLQVEHTESATYTRVLEKLDARTAEMARDLAVIKHQNALEQLDRDWQTEREGLMVRGKNGTMHEPSTGASILAIVIGGGFGIFWTIVASQFASGFFAIFGVLFVVFIIAAGISNYRSAIRFSARRDEYERRRRELERDDPAVTSQPAPVEEVAVPDSFARDES
jgi:DNA-directed RNA polymerase subunit RPC12/RpoP